MAFKRILPILLYNGKGLVKTVRFKNPKYIGDPINAIRIFNDKEVDEVIVLDIMAKKEGRRPNFAQIEEMTSEAFMPFTYGGGVTEIADFDKLFRLGVEKVVVNTLITDSPDTVRKAVTLYGSQAIVAGVDFGNSLFAKNQVYSYANRKIKYTLQEYVRYVSEDLGVGEVFLQSKENEGTYLGYKHDVVESVASAINVPVIACGGCNSVEDMKKVLYSSGAEAAAIGSMSVYSKQGMGVLINFPQRTEIITENND